jgi:plastocyanin
MRRAGFLVIALAAVSIARASTLEVTARNTKGALLEHAIAYATPKAGAVPAGARRIAQIAQVNKAFAPFVTVVQTGTTVQFPNRDPIRHHVYSFSPAKPFEIKLYAGMPPAPIVFDKPGEVVLGCNIHDTMLAFVLVVETPYFAKAGPDGRARIENLPAGEYEVRLWYYGQAIESAPQSVKLRADETAEAAFTVTPKAVVARPPGP